MVLRRREFLRISQLYLLFSVNASQLTNYNIETGEYDATDLLRDLTDEARGAQRATGDAIITAADSGVIDEVEINNAGTINATIILDEVGSEEDVYIYEEGGARRMGYKYHSDRYDLGDRFADLKKANRLVKVLNKFNESYLPELLDQPASELLPDQTETTTDAQTEVETEKQNTPGAEDTTDEVNEGILSPLTQDVLTIMGGTGVTLAAIYRYILSSNADD